MQKTISSRVTVSFAQSLDGRIATMTGSSRWISGTATLVLAHRLRHDSDAVLVGSGTVLADDPELTCRLGPDGNVIPVGGSIVPGHTPVRIVVDAALRTPEHSRLVATASGVPTYVLCARGSAGSEAADRLEKLGVHVVEMEPDADGRLPTREIVDWTARQGYASLLVEGGSKIITSFIRARLVDRLVIVTAPIIIGEGVSAVGNLGVQDLAEAIRADTVSTKRMGQDLVWDLRFRRGPVEDPASGPRNAE